MLITSALKIAALMPVMISCVLQKPLSSHAPQA